MLSRYNCTVPWVPEVPGAKICTEKKVTKVAIYDPTFFAVAVIVVAAAAAADVAVVVVATIAVVFMLLLIIIIIVVVAFAFVATAIFPRSPSTALSGSLGTASPTSGGTASRPATHSWWRWGPRTPSGSGRRRRRRRRRGGTLPRRTSTSRRGGKNILLWMVCVV